MRWEGRGKIGDDARKGGAESLRGAREGGGREGEIEG